MRALEDKKWLYNKYWGEKDTMSPISKVFEKRGAWCLWQAKGEEKLFSLDCQVKCNNFLRKISSGAFQPKDLRGLRLRSRATLSASSCVTSAKDVRLGKN